MPHLPIVTRIFLDAAERLGYQAKVLDPEYGYLFEVGDGQTWRTMLGGRSPLNDAVAARLAEDKHYTGLLLARAGLRVPQTVRCLSPVHPSLHRYRERAGLGSGLALAEKLGFPLVVKPNRLSHGRGVRWVESRRELEDSVRAAWEIDAIALVQEAIEGRDFRLDFLDGEFLAGYERKPIVLVGDGSRDVASLLSQLDGRYHDPDRRTVLLDRLTPSLAPFGIAADTILAKDECVRLAGSILNLSFGSTARVIESLPSGMLDLARRVSSALRLRHFGIDLRASNLEANDPVILEVNASPLLSQLYLLGHHELVLRAQGRVLCALFR